MRRGVRITGRKYPKPEMEGTRGWTKWIQPHRRIYRIACCDCSLVHDMQFALEKRGKRAWIFFRVRRNQRATGAMRRGIERLVIMQRKK